MVQVTAEEAKVNLSALIAHAMKGETVFITEGEDRLVQLVPVVPNKGDRTPGSAKGLFVMAEDFDAPLEDFKEYME